MKKYFTVAFLLSFSVSFLKAQEQDSTKVQNQQEEPVIAPTGESNKPTDGIIITGPDGVIIEEPAEKYSLDREKYSMEEDESLDSSKSAGTMNSAMKNEDEPEIFYYDSPSNQQGDRYYRRKDEKSDIKTLAGSMNHSGGFGAVSFRYSDFRDESMVMAGFRGGWIVNRTLGIGFEGHGVIPTSRYEDIDDSRDVVLVGGYGGMFLELIFFSNQVIHVTFPVSAGAGWLGYTEHWENDFTNPPFTPGDSLFHRRDQLIDDDTFWYIEPGANLELNISRNFRMCFGVSKRFTQDFLLVNTNNNAFDKPNYYVTLKFGKF